MTKTEFNPYEDKFTRDLARRKSRQLVGKYGYTDADRDDIEQDIYMRVLQSWPTFNPDEGHHHCFVIAVVERYVANIVRDRCAEKRYEGGVVLLSTPLAEASGETLRVSHTLSDGSQDRRLGRRRRAETELSQMRLDLAAAIESLPDELKQLMELRRTFTVKEIAEQFGVARTTASGWFRKIRDHFEALGLKEYFDETSSHRP
jgi:RNA polymerase sigma-70 factor, ECF subfamily